MVQMDSRLNSVKYLQIFCHQNLRFFLMRWKAKALHLSFKKKRKKKKKKELTEDIMLLQKRKKADRDFHLICNYCK